MDVVLRPIGPTRTDWSLTDRLGRALGVVRSSGEPATFEISAEPGTSLHGIQIAHTSLDAAMTAIATRMAGACSLDSQA